MRARGFACGIAQRGSGVTKALRINSAEDTQLPQTWPRADFEFIEFIRPLRDISILNTSLIGRQSSFQDRNLVFRPMNFAASMIVIGLLWGML